MCLNPVTRTQDKERDNKVKDRSGLRVEHIRQRRVTLSKKGHSVREIQVPNTKLANMKKHAQDLLKVLKGGRRPVGLILISVLKLNGDFVSKY